MPTKNTLYGQRYEANGTLFIESTFGGNTQFGVANNERLAQDTWFHQICCAVGNESTAYAQIIELSIYEEGTSQATARRRAFGRATIPAGERGPYLATVDLVTPFLGQRGKRYVVAVVAISNFVKIYGFSGDRSGGRHLWFRHLANLPTPELFGPATILTGPNIVPKLYAWGEDNVNPTVPTALTPAAGSSTLDTTPVLGMTHNDANSDAGDTLLGATFIVQKTGSGEIVWNIYKTAFLAEQAASRIARTYAGASLIPGETYRWTGRTRDAAGQYSVYAPWQVFTILDTGDLTPSATVPPAKTELLTGNTFAATYAHANGLAMDRARAQLLINEVIVWSGAAAGFVPAGGNVANGGTLTFTQAQAGMPSLAAGRNYQLQLKARDTNGNWSDWSATRTFRTNAPPSKPANLSPDTTEATTTRPRLVFYATDPDTGAGYAEGDLTATVRLKDDAGTIRFTRAATLVDAATGRWEYQTTATDEPALGAGQSVSRTWDAQLNDGTFVGYLSNEAHYVYANGPEVTITSPGAVLTTATGPIRWTVVGDQVSRTVRIWEGSPVEVLVLTDTVTTGDQSFVVPSGTLYNNTEYTVIVSVTNAAGVTGQRRQAFLVDFPEPPPMQGINAALVAADGETQPSRVELSWEATQESPAAFASYIVTRRFEREGVAEVIELARLTNPAQTSLEDEHPPTGDNLVYTVRQVTLDANGETLISAPATFIVPALDLETTILVSVVNPRLRVELTYADSVDVAPENEVLELTTWAGGPALIFTTGSERRTESATFNLVQGINQPNVLSPDEQMTILRAMSRSDSPVSVRDGRRPRWFAMMKASESDQPIGRYDVALSLTEVMLKEGQAAP